MTAIGVALPVLAWVQRHRLLAWFSLGYLLVALIPIDLLPGRSQVTIGQYAPADSVPRLLVTAGALVLGSLGFALYRRGAHWRRR